MSFNLVRNTRVFFTTNLDAAGNINNTATTAFGATNTAEIQVLDGFSFSQGTQQQAITITEGGNTPNRGSRSFNTQLDPVDWSFSTYFRPDSAGASAQVTTSDRWLWNALFGPDPLTATPATVVALTRAVTTGVGASIATVTIATDVTATYPVGGEINLSGATSAVDWNVAGRITTSTFATSTTTLTVELAKAPGTASGLAATGTLRASTGQFIFSPITGTAAGSFAYASTINSNSNQLQRFGLLFLVDNVLYAVDNCALDQASVDFGLDSIAMTAWSGKGTRLREITAGITASTDLIIAGITANLPTSTARYITNKLSTASVIRNIGGTDGTSAKTYNIAITGGNVTIANNLTYLTPNNLGVVNQSIGYFTGTRAITGNITAYLRTGSIGITNGSGTLLSDILTDNAAETKFSLTLALGGGANATRVEFAMPGVMLQVPTIDVQDVVSTQITFAAQPFNPDTVGAGQAYSATDAKFDLSRTNELQVRWFAN